MNEKYFKNFRKKIRSIIFKQLAEYEFYEAVTHRTIDENKLRVT
jgi:hypothetical protein